MEEQIKTNAGQGLGIAGLVLGILSVILALLGCTFLIALLLGVVGIILSAVGFSQAKRNNGAKGINLGALVVSIIGVLMALTITVFLGSFFKDLSEGEHWWNKIEQMEDFDISDEISKSSICSILFYQCSPSLK